MRSSWKDDLQDKIVEQNTKINDRFNLKNTYIENKIEDTINERFKEFQATILITISNMITVQMEKINALTIFQR